MQTTALFCFSNRILVRSAGCPRIEPFVSKHTLVTTAAWPLPSLGCTSCRLQKIQTYLAGSSRGAITGLAAMDQVRRRSALMSC
jgi:hypothetical protein